MPKLRVGCHAEVMLHQPRGQIPPLTPSLTCLDAFKLPVRQTSSLEKRGAVHRAHRPCSKGVTCCGDGPWHSRILPICPNLCSYCSQGMAQIMRAGWWTLPATRAGATCRQSGCHQGKLDEMRAGFHSSDKCTGVDEGCRGASPRTAPCTAQCAEPLTARTA